MSDDQRVTFEVTCAACGTPFSMRRELADPDAEGSAEVVVECQYCNERIKVEIPRKYAQTETLLKGVKSAKV
ncbi:MAG: hypothetical protein AAF533_14170 [Acidobacteriota bacterium]